MLRNIGIRFLPLILAIMLGGIYLAPKAEAVSGADWKAGKIIDDYTFTAKDGMSVNEIQAFLNSRVGTGGYDSVPGQCDTNGSRSAQPFASGSRASYAASLGRPTTFTCLNNYYEVPKLSPGPEIPANNYGGGAIPPGAKSAAQLIWDAAQRYNISPRVLLVTIQKESAGPLTTDDWPFQKQYLYAMGAHCPDSGPNGSANCNVNYAGFSLQISESAALLRYYLDNMDQSWWPYKRPGNNSILYHPNAGCGNSNVFVETKATAALYTYTPYQPNAAALGNLYGTGDGCSSYGNRNFWRIYNDWFGTTISSQFAFTAPGNPIYLYVGGYKIIASHMGILQDYGISPQSIQTVSQATIDSIPSPPSNSGISNTLSYLVKSTSDSDDDGGNLYLISIGKKYPFASLEQFYEFGFKLSDIAYVPLSHLYSMPTAQSLSNFVQAPNGALFQVSDAKKHNIFEFDTYKTLNPSDRVSAVSYYTVNLIPSGNPASNRQILIKTQGSESVSVYYNGKYFSIPSFDTYNCWGFSSTGVPVYRVIDNSYITPINPTSSLGCLTNDGAKTYLLSKTSQIEIPTQFGLPVPSQSSADVLSMASKLPIRSAPLKQYMRSNSNPAVYFLEGGARKPVPTYSNFVLLNITGAQLDIIDDSSMSSFPAPSGIKLGAGQAVKTDSSPTVYLVSGNTRVAFTSSDEFLGSGNGWGDVETYSAATLNSEYPYGSEVITRYLYSQSQSKTYLLDPNGCVYMPESLLADYGQSQSVIAAAQSYNANIFPKLNTQNCRTGSTFIKQPGQSTVYWINGGNKHLISRWDTLTSKSGSSNPYVVTLTPSTLSTIPTGQPLD